MMTYNFDDVIERHGSDSMKWQKYPKDILPLWVADMDFVSPPAVLDALQARIAHGVFGYGGETQRLADLICDRLARLYRWQVSPEHIVFLPGLVAGLNVMCRAIGKAGDKVVVQTPVYPPFLTAPTNQARQLSVVELAARQVETQQLYYEQDLAAFKAALTPDTSLFILCHPHNPVGRLWTPEELTQLAEHCLANDVVICSDEIHCDLVLDGRQHVPMASLAPEIADNCITLMAPSKTFNIAGLGCSFAVVQNAQLRKQVKRAAAGIIPEVNILGLVAAIAAYEHGDPWLQDLLRYLAANRDYVQQFVQTQLPDIRATVPEATYLTWLDFRDLAHDNPHKLLLEQAKVALNDGVTFGAGGEGFVRLNFGCPRSTLETALNRLKQALYP